MLDIASGPKNKIELESQILCTALRQSWNSDDQQGARNSAAELHRLFPDLLPPLNKQAIDNYKLLNIKPQASASTVIVGYLSQVRKYLHKKDLKDCQGEFNRILDAGFILRKSRLRLSHDLVMVRNWLIETNTITDSGAFELAEGICDTKPQIEVEKPEPAKLPQIAQLLNEAQFIGESEMQALAAQLALAPDVSIEHLILDSGYVSLAELNSLKLAELLLGQGKISMAQFQVAMYDERTSGIRMAESLQIRGWLPVEVPLSHLE